MYKRAVSRSFHARAISSLARLSSPTLIPAKVAQGLARVSATLFPGFSSFPELPHRLHPLPFPSFFINLSFHHFNTNNAHHFSQCLQERESRMQSKSSKHSQVTRATRKKSKTSLLDVMCPPTALPTPKKESIDHSAVYCNVFCFLHSA